MAVISTNSKRLHPLLGSEPKLLANSYSENVAIDLESFSRHAGRTKVNTDDVLLVTRRNDDLQAIIRDFIDKEKAKKAKSKSRR